MTKLTFLGSGSAFYLNAENFKNNQLPENWQSNMVLERNGKYLLIDCGGDIRFSLAQAGYSLEQMTDIYVSHPHADHVGGLEFVGLASYFHPKLDRPKLYLADALENEVWTNSLSGGLGTLQGEAANLRTFFDVQAIGSNQGFVWEGIKFQLVQVVHTMNGGVLMPSYGLWFTIPEIGKRVFITTDTQFCPHQIRDFYRRSDLIFHDCETSFKSGVHAHYEDLKTLPTEEKEKMWLYHFQPNYKSIDAKSDGFMGFVERGQTFEF